MPDLSHRPTRYVTVALLAAVLAGAAVTQLDVRIGPDTRLAALNKQNVELRRESERMHEQQQRPSGAPRPAAVHLGPAQPVVVPAAVASSSGPATTVAVEATRRTTPAAADCARYPTQEAAQAAFDANRVALAAMDGNHNGKACEQLRSAVTTQSVAPRRPDEPTAPPAQPAAPAGPVLPTAPPKAQILASGMHFGLSAATTEEFGTLEASLQRQTTMSGFFTGFDSPFPRDRVVASWQAGQIPYMTWESRPLTDRADPVDYSLRHIADGTFDDYLVTYARSVTELGLPLVLRFDQEMNGNWYRWAEFENPQLRQGDYVAAWRHIHDIFEAQGANAYVMWLWSPNRIDNLSRFPAIDRYWPGDAYVDQVGMTGYLRAEDRAPLTFAGTYDRTLRELRRVAPGKPLLLSEVGATEDGGHKVAWLQSFFPGLLANPDIAGFVWFNYAITDRGHTNDWRVNSTDASYQAFSQGLSATTYGLEVGKKFTLRPRATTAVPTPAPTPTPAPSPGTAPLADRPRHRSAVVTLPVLLGGAP